MSQIAFLWVKIYETFLFIPKSSNFYHLFCTEIKCFTTGSQGHPTLQEHANLGLQ